MITSIRLRWSGHLARIEEGSGDFRFLTGKPTGKKSLGRPRHRREGDIKCILKKWALIQRTGFFGSGQGLLVSPYERGIKPQGVS